MRHIDLFSGIGGFSLSAEWVWDEEHEIVAFVEQDKYCQERLNGLWPNVPIVDDIRNFNGKEYRGTIDLLTGGFPCQPFSVAGKQRGKEDDRFLWHEMLRVIQEAKPTWIIGENVIGIIKMELDNCITELEGEGYEVQTFDIPACGVDARHRRARVWIVAHSGHNDGVDFEIPGNNGQGSAGPSEGQNGTIKPERSGSCEGRAESLGRDTNGRNRNKGQVKEMEKREDTKSSRVCTDVADTDSTGQRERWGAKPIQKKLNTSECNDEIVPYSNSSSSDTGEESTRRETWSNVDRCCKGATLADTDKQHGNNGGSGTGKTPQREEAGICEGEQWPTEPGVGRVAHGIPNRVDRLKGLGNAIVPQVAEEIMRCIKALNITKE